MQNEEFEWLRHAPDTCGRQTLNGRLPLEQGSESHQNLSKRVSDDLQLFIFLHQKLFAGNFFLIGETILHEFGQVFEEQRPNGHQNQLPRQILLQIDLS